MKNTIALAILVITILGCSSAPTDSDIQTAIAMTAEVAPTETPIPIPATYTPVSTVEQDTRFSSTIETLEYIDKVTSAMNKDIITPLENMTLLNIISKDSLDMLLDEEVRREYADAVGQIHDGCDALRELDPPTKLQWAHSELLAACDDYELGGASVLEGLEAFESEGAGAMSTHIELAGTYFKMASRHLERSTREIDLISN